MNTDPLSMRMLVIPTAHLSNATRCLLQNDEDVGVLYYPKGPWGWFCCVTASDEDCEFEESTPADIKACIEYARNKSAQWLVFDHDVPPALDLPLYNDTIESTPDTGIYASQLAQAYARHLSQRFGRDLNGKVTPGGEIKVTDGLDNGFFAEVSIEFALSRLVSPLRIVDEKELVPAY